MSFWSGFKGVWNNEKFKILFNHFEKKIKVECPNKEVPSKELIEELQRSIKDNVYLNDYKWV